MSAGTILGINPGTREIAVAVLRDDVLLHAQVRSFQGTWSDDKLRSILRFIEDLLHKYGVTEVSVKVPDVLPLSKSFHQLVGTINVLLGERGIRPRYYSLSEIKARHCFDKYVTREQLLSVMLERHPELLPEYQCEKQNENKYYYRLFEAVAAARME